MPPNGKPFLSLNGQLAPCEYAAQTMRLQLSTRVPIINSDISRHLILPEQGCRIEWAHGERSVQKSDFTQHRETGCLGGLRVRRQ